MMPALRFRQTVVTPEDVVQPWCALAFVGGERGWLCWWFWFETEWARSVRAQLRGKRMSIQQTS